MVEHSHSSQNKTSSSKEKFEEAYKAVFDASPQPMLVLDLETLIFLSVNQAAIDEYGYSKQEFLELTLLDIQPITELNLISESFQSENSFHRVQGWKHKKKDGRVIGVEVSSNTLMFHGRPACLVIVNDVTEQLKFEEALSKSEANLKAIFENSNQAFILLDRNLFIRSANTLAQKLSARFTNRSMQEDDNFRDFISPEYAEVYENSIAQALSGHVVKQEIFRTLDEIQKIWFQTIFCPVYSSDKIIGVCISVLDITDRKWAEQALQASQQRFQALVQHSSDIVTILDPVGTISYLSPSAEQMLGWSPQEIEGLNGFDFVHELDRPKLLDLFTQTIQDPNYIAHFQYRFLHKNGSWVDLEAVGSNLFGEPSVNGMVVNSREITDRKRAQAALLESQQLLERITNAAPNIIVLIDIFDSRIVYVNEACEAILGFSPTEFINKGTNLARSLLHPDDLTDSALIKNRILRLKDKEVVEYEFRFQDNKQNWRRMSMQISMFSRNTEGQVQQILASIEDITTRKQLEDELTKTARFDSLTGLPNRHFFMTRLEQTAKRLKKSKKGFFAVLFLDLDRFKFINDSLGHNTGDRLLIAIARRLENCIRQRDIVARLGGDEFTILLDELENFSEVERVTQRIQEELARPFVLNHNRVHITVSIGIALSKDEYQKATDIIRDADTAMYRAKDRGRNSFEIFNQDMHRYMLNFLKMEASLRDAIDNTQTNELRLYYQPIVNLRTGKIESCEALLRWQHPSKGLIGPGEFLSVAEETGLIVQLDKWVLQTACQQNALWQKAGLPKINICVNLSMAQFKQQDLPSQVSRALKKSGLEASYLELEMTEKIIIDNIETSLLTLHELRDMGVKISIDDFGTGYSSLTYLKQLPINTVKIDQSFIKDISTNKDSAAIVSSVVSLVQKLRLEVVAEGIEKRTQLRILKSQKCNYGQGFLFGKAVSEAQFRKLLKQNEGKIDFSARQNTKKKNTNLTKD